MRYMREVYKVVTLVLVTTLLSACGGSEDTEAPEELTARDITPEVEAFYADNPDFFSFKTLADLPPDLTWINNDHLPEVGSPNAKKGGTEYGRLQDFPRTLRTVGPDSNGSFRTWLLDDVQLQLAHIHPDHAFDYYPGLAETWAIDKENKTIYVKLDREATYSDGVPITVDDYFFMFFFYRSAYIVAPWYNNYYSTQYTNITKYDDHTMSISIPEAKPDMDARGLEIRPIPSHFFKELGDDFVDRYQWRFMPTTGPYVIEDDDIKKGRSITLRRNPDWWAKDKKSWRYRYNADKVHLSVIRDTPKVFEAFKRGDIDQFGLSLAEYWYEKLPDSDSDVQAGYIHKSEFYNQRPRPNFGLWINTSRPLLDNQDIRVGINHASNWEVVIEKFFRGDNRRLKGPAHGFGEFSHPDLTARPFDIELAQEAFARAGFTERGPDGVLMNADGVRLAFTLSTGYESLKDILTILKEEALKAGLEFRIEVLDGTSGWKKVQEKKHDIHFAAFAVQLEMYPRFWDFYHSDNAYDDAFLADGSINPERKVKVQTNNLEVFNNFEMDGLIDQYRASDDKQEMIGLAHQMSEIHFEHASFVPGYYQPMYRVGHWRWVKYPDGFNNKHSSRASKFFVHWIDTDVKEETLAAKKDGRTFSPEINLYDQFLEK